MGLLDRIDGQKKLAMQKGDADPAPEEIKEKVDIDLEVFIHGALCVSYSGQCIMSSMLGGRSGNRGACVGSCRLPYKLIKNDNEVILKNKAHVFGVTYALRYAKIFCKTIEMF